MLCNFASTDENQMLHWRPASLELHPKMQARMQPQAPAPAPPRQAAPCVSRHPTPPKFPASPIGRMWFRATKWPGCPTPVWARSPRDQRVQTESVGRDRRSPADRCHPAQGITASGTGTDPVPGTFRPHQQQSVPRPACTAAQRTHCYPHRQNGAGQQNRTPKADRATHPVVP